MGTGESPYEAAAREVGEEAGLMIKPEDLHLFSMIAEKNYEDRCHWLMFLFDCRKRLEALPPPIGEGRFAFFREAEIPGLKLPETDRKALWKVYREARSGFTALRADCRSGRELIVEIEEQMDSGGWKAAP
jgi:8-oxo-dGTP diphosphatase